ncbi:hypothetical protein NE237_015953 [Protea cynaroides]|uniref:Uncharacterized protein n=1 Tax=Protea cynaroides TaxID=273540 RepID=A0A9Q0QRI6_9MAGN|nr:hypothetical protein NE237_015953 [Protea cynaroides]
MHYIDTLVDFDDGRYQQDPLRLALAKMTYAVYPLGEGIIGQVAASGTQQWTSADRPASGSWSSSEYCDGWQTQFSAGIREIVDVKKEEKQQRSLAHFWFNEFLLYFRSDIYPQTSRYMRSKISFSLQEGKMHGLSKLRGAKMS